MAVEHDDRRRADYANGFARSESAARELFHIGSARKPGHVVGLVGAMPRRHGHRTATLGGYAKAREIPLVHQRIDRRHSARYKERGHESYGGASGSPEDAAAARRLDGYLNRWYLDALAGRPYPGDIVEWYGDLLEPSAVAEMADYRPDLDFLGINYYSRHVVRASTAELLGVQDVRTPDATYTTMGWEVYPEGLFEILERVAREYQPRALRDRERRFVRGSARERKRSRSGAHRLSLGTFVAGGARDRSGRPARGLLHLVADGQFRVVARLHEALRHRVRGHATQQRIAKESARWYRDFLAVR